MKQLFFGLQLSLLTVFAFAKKSSYVNAVIGDESFIAFFQQLPDETTNETLRLQTHLAYVEGLSLIKTFPT